MNPEHEMRSDEAWVGSLCSGYGGLDLAAEEVFGARTVWHAENAAAPSKILATRWPGVRNYGDISAVGWDAPRVDIATAGYPCQPFSHSGRRKGEDDERHLWPIVAETVRRCSRRSTSGAAVTAAERSTCTSRILSGSRHGSTLRWTGSVAGSVRARGMPSLNACTQHRRTGSRS